MKENIMKTNGYSRFRRSLMSLTFAVAAIAGGTLPVADANAASPITNLMATWNSAERTVELSWNGTGISSDRYTVMFNTTNGSAPALDEQGSPLQNLTATTAVSKNDSAYDSGQTLRFSIYTISTDSTYAESNETTVTVPANTGTSPHASAPLNISTGIYNNIQSVYWAPPLESGTTPISGWQISISKEDGGNPQDLPPLTDPTDRSQILTYPFVNGETYKVTVAAINGVDGVSPNSANVTFIYTGTTQPNGTQISNSTPRVPNTGFPLSLANPLVIVTLGAASAATLLVIQRRMSRRS